MELRNIKQGKEFELGLSEFASTCSGNSSLGAEKNKVKGRDRKNKSLIVKRVNKLLDLKTCEDNNDLEEIEYLRDCPLDLQVVEKKKFEPEFIKNTRRGSDEKSKKLAHSVLFNKDPDSLLTVEDPKNVQGVIFKYKKSDVREDFLQNLRNQICGKKIQAILKDTEDQGEELEERSKRTGCYAREMRKQETANEDVGKALGSSAGKCKGVEEKVEDCRNDEKLVESFENYENTDCDEGLEIGKVEDNCGSFENYEDKHKNSDKIKDFEESTDCFLSTNSETSSNNFANGIEKSEDFENFSNKLEKSQTVYDLHLSELLEFDKNTNLKRKLEDSNELPEKRIKNSSGGKENSQSIKTHDLENEHYDEEDHILHLKHIRILKSSKPDQNIETNNPDTSLDFIEKPDHILVKKSLLNLEIKKNHKPEAKPNQTSFFSYNTASKSNIPGNLRQVKTPQKKKSYYSH